MLQLHKVITNLRKEWVSPDCAFVISGTLLKYVVFFERLPAWVAVETICNHSEQLRRHCKLQSLGDLGKLREFVRDHVKHMLIHNYGVLKLLEHNNASWLSDWHDLYPDRLAIDPVGKSPLDV